MKRNKTSRTIQVYQPSSFEVLTCRIYLDSAKSRIRYINGKNIYIPSKEYIQYKNGLKWRK